nr:BTAD domain-containing putative transcriptional regulator [Nocardiopsis valliformis]
MVPTGRQQAVFSSLLLEVGHVVSTHCLLDTVWEHDPPETARTQVQICVSRLRRLIGSTGAVIETRSPGYVLRAPEGTVDFQHQRLLARRADDLLERGEDEEAVRLLRRAVGLWRGPTLAGVDYRAVRVKAAELDEVRASLLEKVLDAELRLGRHTETVAEAGRLVEEYPLREGMRANLMLALYRSGRQAEALEVLRAGRELQQRELGTSLGKRLRSLEEGILAGDPALAAPDRTARTAGAVATGWRSPAGRNAVESAVSAGAGNTGSEGTTPNATGPAQVSPSGPVPLQLPHAIADFVGREEVLATVRAALVGDSATGVAVLVGRPGVGKSSTAVWAAHRLAGRDYPDGQLYCDLRGTGGEPMDPADVLGRFLRALGVAAQDVPDDIDERACVYRGLLANRRVLVVLDDAAAEAQVLPLLPGHRRCGVIVTSRSRFTGLPGVVPAEMEPLSADQSVRLLRRVLGEDRVAREEGATHTLVRMVGRLPLALRVAAARLAARPHWPIASLVERLADERSRLDELTHGELTVRASLSLTYEGLGDGEIRAFAILGMVAGPTIPSWMVGAVFDDRRTRPSDLAEPLVDAYVLDVIGRDSAGEPVYRFPDLVRAYAREKLYQAQDESARSRLLERVTGVWSSLVEEADRRTGGSGPSRPGAAPAFPALWSPPDSLVERLLADPVAWFEQERANLFHAVAQTAGEGLFRQCWRLAAGLSEFLLRRGDTESLRDVYESALPLTEEAPWGGAAPRGSGAVEGSAGAGRPGRVADPGHGDLRNVHERVLAVFTARGEEQGRVLVLRHLSHLDARERAREREHEREGAVGWV